MAHGRLPHSWVGKALAQKALSKLGLLPAYYALQRLGGRLKGFHPSSRAEYAAKLYQDVAPHRHVEGAAILEIGTGWVPVVPLLLHLMGAKRIITVDLNRHLQAELTLQVVPLLADCLEELQRRCGVSTRIMRTRLQSLLAAESVEDLFSRAGIEYRAPADAANTKIETGTIDIVYSNLVLEHVPQEVLLDIHSESLRLLAPDGVIWHNVDYSDHYATTRQHLSPINMLRYSERFWSLVGQNDILYQNRMRRSQHAALFAAVGLEEVSRVDSKTPSIRDALARGFRLDPAYAGFPPSELEVVASRFVLRGPVY